jgi:hypothetical protein
MTTRDIVAAMEKTDQFLAMKRQSNSATPRKLRPDEEEATEEHRGAMTFDGRKIQ